MAAAQYAKRLASLSTQIQEIDSTRNRLLAQLADLDAISSALMAEYNSIHNRISAVASLPNEILASIFEAGHRSEHSEGFELLVSQITRHWRDVSLNTPKLWSRIHRKKFQQPEPSALYFNRSMAVAIDLTVNIGCTDNPNNEDDVTPFCQLMAVHISRCYRLVVTSDSKSETNTLLRFLYSSIGPLLTIIDISCTSDALDLEDLSAAPREMFTGGTPLLNSVRITSRCCLPPMGSVTALHLLHIEPGLRMSAERLRDVLASLASLIFLEVEGEVVTSWTPRVTVKLPSLQTLQICADNDQPIANQFYGLYAAIDAPSLEVLSLRNPVDDDLIFLGDAYLGAPKFPALHTLILRDTQAISSQLSPIMRAFPAVRNVTFGGHARALLLLLQEDKLDSAGGIFWPRLRNLALPYIPSPFAYNMAYEFIIKRISIGHPIESLSLPGNLVSDVSRTTMNDGPPLSSLVRVDECEDDAR